MTRARDGFLRLLREWFTVFLPTRRAASPNTIESHRVTWNMLLRHIAETRGVAVEDATFALFDQETVAGFIDHMASARGWTASTCNQRLAGIRSFFKYAAGCEPLLAVHLAALNAIPQRKGAGPPPVPQVSPEAVKALLDTPDPSTRLGLRDQFFMVLMYDLAARDGEMLAMRFADLKRKAMTVDLLGKGSKPRRLPITARTAAHFDRYQAAFHPHPEPGDPMFHTIHAGRKTAMSDDNAARFIARHAAAARSTCPEVPERFHPHLLRHARALHLYQAGMPLALLTEWLGHKDPKTTLIYARADTEMKRKALDKANPPGHDHQPTTLPIWHDDQDIIARLCGLT
jgi:site-specific recombinase XerD